MWSSVDLKVESVMGFPQIETRQAGSRRCVTVGEDKGERPSYSGKEYAVEAALSAAMFSSSNRESLFFALRASAWPLTHSRVSLLQ